MIDGNWLSYFQKKNIIAGAQYDKEEVATKPVLDDENDGSSDSELDDEVKKFSSSKLNFHSVGSTITDIDIEGLIKSDPLPIKGIVSLANFRYRIQLNTFQQTRKKFSRNSTDLDEVSHYYPRFSALISCPH